MEIYLAHAKSRRFFSNLKELGTFQHLTNEQDTTLPLDELSIPKTTFTSPFRKYEYIKIPFGLAQTPAYFQELITGVLRNFSSVISYVEEIIIFSRMAEEHLSHNKQVFQRIDEA